MTKRKEPKGEANRANLLHSQDPTVDVLALTLLVEHIDKLIQDFENNHDRSKAVLTELEQLVVIAPQYGDSFGYLDTIARYANDLRYEPSLEIQRKIWHEIRGEHSRLQNRLSEAT